MRNTDKEKEFLEFARDWRKRDKEEREAHQKKMEEKYEVVGNSKANRLYEICWDLGHAHGFEEIENYYMDFVELIR